MNKQVFGLLAIGRFISMQSGLDLESDDVFDVDAAARKGVSSFLTEAVNQVADDLVKGVDIDFNLKDYQDADNTLTRTDLDVAVSKKLMNNRLIISVGTNFMIDSHGSGNAPQKSGTEYIPDVSATYKLSRDGRYMLRVYRKNEYDAVVEGYFAETGVSFTIEMAYDRFKQIFQKVPVENQLNQ
jgi:translocation and assembly module TamB